MIETPVYYNTYLFAYITDVRRNVLTICVNNTTRTITPARGRCNRGPDDKRAGERLSHAPEILKEWAVQEKLTVPGYI